MKTKGFKFTTMVKPINQGNVSEYTIIRGNFFLELTLPNAYKIRDFKKLRDRLNKWVSAHNGKFPDSISVSPRQYCEYEELFITQTRQYDNDFKLRFNGVPLNKRPQSVDRMKQQ